MSGVGSDVASGPPDYATLVKQISDMQTIIQQLQADNISLRNELEKAREEREFHSESSESADEEFDIADDDSHASEDSEDPNEDDIDLEYPPLTSVSSRKSKREGTEQHSSGDEHQYPKKRGITTGESIPPSPISSPYTISPQINNQTNPIQNKKSSNLSQKKATSKKISKMTMSQFLNSQRNNVIATGDTEMTSGNPNPQTTKSGTTSNNNSNNGDKVGKTKSLKMPPIIAFNIKPKSFRTLISTKLGHTNFSFKSINANKTHILTKDKDSFIFIKNILNQQGTGHFHQTLSDDKSRTVLLKNMPSDYDEEEVKQILHETFPKLNLKISKFRPPPRFLKSNPKKYQNLNIWQINCSPETDISLLIKTSELRCIQQYVKFELYNSHEIPQCKNCQRYGHIKRNCTMTSRCVRCGGEHDKEHCQLPKAAFDPTTNKQLEATLPTCCNCGQKGHPANYRCSKYKEIVSRRKEIKAKQAAAQASKQKSFNNFIQKGISFADMARPKSFPKPVQRPVPVPAPRTKKTVLPTPAIAPIDPNFFLNFLQIYQIAQEMKPAFDQCKTPQDRNAFLLAHLLTLK